MAATPSSPYSAGRSVYSGSRTAPNVGAVRSKAGYNQRTLRQQAQQRALQAKYKHYRSQI